MKNRVNIIYLLATLSIISVLLTSIEINGAASSNDLAVSDAKKAYLKTISSATDMDTPHKHPYHHIDPHHTWPTLQMYSDVMTMTYNPIEALGRIILPFEHVTGEVSIESCHIHIDREIAVEMRRGYCRRFMLGQLRQRKQVSITSQWDEEIKQPSLAAIQRDKQLVTSTFIEVMKSVTATSFVTSLCATQSPGYATLCTCASGMVVCGQTFWKHKRLDWDKYRMLSSKPSDDTCDRALLEKFESVMQHLDKAILSYRRQFELTGRLSTKYKNRCLLYENRHKEIGLLRSLLLDHVNRDKTCELIISEMDKRSLHVPSSITDLIVEFSSSLDDDE